MAKRVQIWFITKMAYLVCNCLDFFYFLSVMLKEPMRRNNWLCFHSKKMGYQRLSFPVLVGVDYADTQISNFAIEYLCETVLAWVFFCANKIGIKNLVTLFLLPVRIPPVLWNRISNSISHSPLENTAYYCSTVHTIRSIHRVRNWLLGFSSKSLVFCEQKSKLLTVALL